MRRSVYRLLPASTSRDSEEHFGTHDESSLALLLAGMALVMPVQAGKEAYATGFGGWRAADGGFAG